VKSASSLTSVDVAVRKQLIFVLFFCKKGECASAAGLATFRETSAAESYSLYETGKGKVKRLMLSMFKTSRVA
jgi:hypothetical protein